MRIISGKFKSRIIQYPKTRLTRPVTDKAKETLFNILGGLVESKQVLDLFSGSGSLGLEALSRDAMRVTFVDRADWSSKCIRKNLEMLEVAHLAEVIEGDVIRAIGKLAKQDKKFSLVFVDPPYNQGLVKKTLNKLDQSDILAPFAQVVVGHSAQEPLPESFETMKVTRVKKIGQSFLSFLFRVESKSGETKSYLSGQF